MSTEIVLRDYQDELYDEIQLNSNVQKLLVQLECGGGKSVVIGKLANDLAKAVTGRVWVLTHRIELLEQNAEFIENVAMISSKENTLRYDSKVIIGMVETVYARIKKFGLNYLGIPSVIIVDEVHLDYFSKVYSLYPEARVIGFTATPMTNKRELKKVDGVEFSRPLTMANEFDKLITGVTTQKLIDLGFLCQDYNIVLRLPDIDKLKVSESDPDGYTKKSINEVYNNTASLDILHEAYERYGKGKKTIIFNANSTINKSVFDYLSERGVNCRLFDSVNKTDLNRDDTVEWFRNTPDAVLINANIFLVGFNVPEIETILFNRATKSLALYMQAAGRGARPTKKIYKDKFTFVDLGQNIAEHGPFSSLRNWQDHFIEQPWKRKVAMDLLKVWSCTFCDSFNPVGIEECEVCFMPKEDVIVEENNKKFKTGEFEALGDMPLPRAKAIIDYSLALNKDSNFAFKLLEERIVDLFIHYKVSSTFYNKRKEDFHKRVRSIYTPIYFAIIKNKELVGANKTLETQVNKLFTKIDKLYNNDTVGTAKQAKGHK